jgi:drug/metabolite transporter (DMT)-like permease
MPNYSAAPVNDSDNEDEEVITRSMSRQMSHDVRNSRLSRNSTGVKNIEAVTYTTEEEAAEDLGGVTELKGKDGKMLTIVFFLMLFVGLGNKIFQKLMTIPMYNYPNSMNLITTFFYVPVCFAYIIPMARSGGIPKEQLELPKKPFAIMGGLDAIAGIMQVFSATYLPGALLILLSQAAIPMSMIISKNMLDAKYSKYQYAGATVVALGIATVLVPSMQGDDENSSTTLWSFVMILSTIPMALSSVYKEIALGSTELDPMYLNGWIATFQFLFSILLCVPSALASDPPVAIPMLPENLVDGMLCYFGTNSVTCTGESGTCTPDDCYPTGPLYVTIYLVFNQLYNLLIILILKYGSANLLFMALTIMVPLGNVAFTLDFVPGHTALKITDIIGLVLICTGLACYRFASEILTLFGCKKTNKFPSVNKQDDKSSMITTLLLAEDDEEA